jgi:hypothetical protein
VKQASSLLVQSHNILDLVHNVLVCSNSVNGDLLGQHTQLCSLAALIQKALPSLDDAHARLNGVDDWSADLANPILHFVQWSAAPLLQPLVSHPVHRCSHGFNGLVT